MCLRCPHCQVQRAIEILVDDQARGWGLTDVDAFSEVHLLFDVTTPRTPLRRREPAIGQEQAFPLPHTLVAHLPPEFAKTHIADGERQLAVAIHAIHMENFQHHHARAQRGIGRSGLPQEPLDLLLLDLVRHPLRQCEYAR